MCNSSRITITYSISCYGEQITGAFSSFSSECESRCQQKTASITTYHTLTADLSTAFYYLSANCSCTWYQRQVGLLQPVIVTAVKTKVTWQKHTSVMHTRSPGCKERHAVKIRRGIQSGHEPVGLSNTVLEPVWWELLNCSVEGPERSRTCPSCKYSNSSSTITAETTTSTLGALWHSTRKAIPLRWYWSQELGR